MHHNCASRRNFLKATLFGGAAAMGGLRWPAMARAAEGAAAGPATSRVALMHGDDRADITFRALQPFGEQIARAIGTKRIVIKPNNVSIDRQLAATHAQSIEGILEFLKSIKKLDNIIIAESAAPGPTLNGFENFGYTKLAAKYNVKLVDLDTAGAEIMHVFDEKDFRPHPVRMSKVLLDPNSFIISAAKLKTHDRVLATLSLKNIVFGAPIKDAGFAWGRGAKPGAKTDKSIAHGSGFRGINFNLFDLARRLHPHLAVIDGYDGMEGNGPVGGTPVDHRVCVVSNDWLAADRVGVELMGIDYANVGYLNYCADAGLGEGDLKKIQVIGEPVEKHIKKYKLSNNVQQQLIWKQRA